MKQEFQRVADVKRLQFITGVLQEHLPAGATVLDVGCGNGIITRQLGAMGFTVLGIDVSQKAIEKAVAANHLPNVSFAVMSAEELVLRNQRFHAVVCSEVLEHLHRPEKLLHTLHQALTVDGVLVVTVPNGRGPREALVTKPVQALQRRNNRLWRLVQACKKALGYSGTTVQSAADDLRHIQFFSKTGLEQLAHNNRFQVVRFGKTNFIEDVFPFSLLTKRLKPLQQLDCAVADMLPLQLNGGFVTVWKKK